MVPEEVFVTILILLLQSKRVPNFQGIFQNIWSRGRSRSQNLDLRRCRAGVERNIFGSATLMICTEDLPIFPHRCSSAKSPTRVPGRNTNRGPSVR
jgi:hypothetical protein